MSSLSSRAGLSSMLSGLWLLVQGTCACSGLVIGSASSIPILETLGSSGTRWLFGLSLVASVISGGMGDVAAIGKGRGGGSS